MAQRATSKEYRDRDCAHEKSASSLWERHDGEGISKRDRKFGYDKRVLSSAKQSETHLERWIPGGTASYHECGSAKLGDRRSRVQEDRTLYMLR